MARPRAKTNTRSAGTFKCPECGRVFERAQALGAHRRQAHGVSGTSRTRSAATRGRSTRSRSSRGQSVNRDALLRALFPNGVPASAKVLDDVASWLNDAERLSRMS